MHLQEDGGALAVSGLKWRMSSTFTLTKVYVLPNKFAKAHVILADWNYNDAPTDHFEAAVGSWTESVVSARLSHHYLNRIETCLLTSPPKILFPCNETEM